MNAVMYANKFQLAKSCSFSNPTREEKVARAVEGVEHEVEKDDFQNALNFSRSCK